MKHITYVGLGMNVILTGTKAFVGFLMNSSSLLADVPILIYPYSSGFTLAIGYDFRLCHFRYRQLQSPSSQQEMDLWVRKVGNRIQFVCRRHLAWYFRRCVCAYIHEIFVLSPSLNAYELFTSLFGAGAEANQVLSHSHELISLSPGSKILDGIGLGILLASVGMKEWLYQETMKISRKTDSSVLKANAWHHRVDALSAIVALVGVSGRVGSLCAIESSLSVFPGSILWPEQRWAPLC